MVSNKEIAEEIVKFIRGNKDITKTRLIQEVSKKLKVGSSTVSDILSQLYALKVVDYKVIQKAKVYFVHEKNLKEIEKIKD
jgi:Mn-dependent DtxR family transcriptional regulator